MMSTGKFYRLSFPRSLVDVWFLTIVTRFEQNPNGNTYNAWNMEFRLHPVFTDKKSAMENCAGVTTKYHRKLLIFAICRKLQLEFPPSLLFTFYRFLLKLSATRLFVVVYRRTNTLCSISTSPSPLSLPSSRSDVIVLDFYHR